MAAEQGLLFSEEECKKLQSVILTNYQDRVQKSANVAIDDEERNCKMFAELGIPVKQYDIETDTFIKYYAPESNEVNVG